MGRPSVRSTSSPVFPTPAPQCGEAFQFLTDISPTHLTYLPADYPFVMPPLHRPHLSPLRWQTADFGVLGTCKTITISKDDTVMLDVSPISPSHLCSHPPCTHRPNRCRARVRRSPLRSAASCFASPSPPRLQSKPTPQARPPPQSLPSNPLQPLLHPPLRQTPLSLLFSFPSRRRHTPHPPPSLSPAYAEYPLESDMRKRSCRSDWRSFLAAWRCSRWVGAPR